MKHPYPSAIRLPFLSLLAAFFLSIFAATAPAQERWPLTVTDLAGRSVTVEKKPEAILLGTGFDLIALSLIHPDPVSLISGWSDDMKNDNPALYAQFAAKFPAIGGLPGIGSGIAGAISMESALTLNADLALLPLWQAESDIGNQAISYLESTGVTVVVIDFTSDPLKNTPASMRLLGKLTEREEQADAFAKLYEDKLALIATRIAGANGKAPSVFMDAFPKPDQCCWAYGLGGFGELLTIAGGRNIADGSLPEQGGTINREYVMGADPEVYIATSTPGGTYSDFAIGPGVAPQDAKETLAAITGSPTLAGTAAVRSGRVHGLWSFFNTVPLNILALEAIAKWLHPELFADIDPDESLTEINERFAAVPFEGTFWTSLQP